MRLSGSKKTRLYLHLGLLRGLLSISSLAARLGTSPQFLNFIQIEPLDMALVQDLESTARFVRQELQS